jgi:hypothetical protein
MRARVAIWSIIGMSCFVAAPLQAQAQAQGADAVDEIVVTARRSGAPVWRVTSPRTTLVIVGSIEEVSRETKWDATSLTAALRMADRVIFPQELNPKASPFAMIGYAVRLLRMAKLPNGQSLTTMMSAADLRRLAALRDKGIIKNGFERTHPLHLSLTLQDIVDGKGYGVDAKEYAKRAVKKYKLRQVPIPSRNVKEPLEALFSSRPEAHIPCLMATVSLMEAGGAEAVKARSDAWADRRVPEAVSSLATSVFETCSLNEYVDNLPDWRGAARRLMNEPEITVAVFDLTAVARRGGLLDEFAAAGYQIKGPAWK